MMHDWGMNWGWGGVVFQALFWLVILIVIIWGVRYFMGQSRSNVSSAGSESALEILKRRYARGEIDKEEFEEKKRDLNS